MALAGCNARLGEFLLFCLDKFICIFPYLAVAVGLIILVVIIHSLVAKNNNNSFSVKRKGKNPDGDIKK